MENRGFGSTGVVGLGTLVPALTDTRHMTLVPASSHGLSRSTTHQHDDTPVDRDFESESRSTGSSYFRSGSNTSILDKVWYTLDPAIGALISTVDANE
jgi:hypothetical protein